MYKCVTQVLTRCCRGRMQRAASTQTGLQVVAENTTDYFTQARVAIDNAVEAAINAAHSAAAAASTASADVTRLVAVVPGGAIQEKWTTVELELSRPKSV